MRKSKLLFIIFLLATEYSYAQSVIISPNNGSSIIEAKGTNKAIKLPSVSATSAIVNPQKGMIVFDDASGTMSYYNGSLWVAMSNTGSTGWALNGSNLYNTNAGSVGIGTNTPDTKLHIVYGASKSGVTPFSSASVAIDRNSGSTYMNFLGNDGFGSGILFGRNIGGGNDGGLIYTSDKSLNFRTNDTSNRLVISSAGYVGIGLTSPSKKLHIHESAASTSSFIKISNAATGISTGMLVGVDVTGRTGIFDAGAGIDINSGPIGLAFTPSSTPSGNAMEISDKGLFSSQLTDVNTVPLAIGQLKFIIENNKIPGTDDYIISGINNYYKGNIITSISHYAVDNFVEADNYHLKIYLDPNIVSKYSKIVMYRNIDSFRESYIKTFSSAINNSNPLNPFFELATKFDFKKYVVINSLDTDFEINFILQGIR